MPIKAKPAPHDHKAIAATALTYGLVYHAPHSNSRYVAYFKRIACNHILTCGVTEAEVSLFAGRCGLCGDETPAYEAYKKAATNGASHKLTQKKIVSSLDELDARLSTMEHTIAQIPKKMKMLIDAVFDELAEVKDAATKKKDHHA